MRDRWPLSQSRSCHSACSCSQRAVTNSSGELDRVWSTDYCQQGSSIFCELNLTKSFMLRSGCLAHPQPNSRINTKHASHFVLFGGVGKDLYVHKVSNCDVLRFAALRPDSVEFWSLPVQGTDGVTVLALVIICGLQSRGGAQEIIRVDALLPPTKQRLQQSQAPCA